MIGDKRMEKFIESLKPITLGKDIKNIVDTSNIGDVIGFSEDDESDLDAKKESFLRIDDIDDNTNEVIATKICRFYIGLGGALTKRLSMDDVGSFLTTQKFNELPKGIDYVTLYKIT